MKARAKNRVLGIDPGFDRLGLAVIEGDASRPEHVWSACVMPARGEPAKRLAAVSRAVADAIRIYAPDIVALETLYFSTNKKTALAVAEARGAALAEAGAAHCRILEFAPVQVKLAVAGYGRADKKAIARMLPRLLVLPDRRMLDDELDAIAVAIAGLSTRV